MRHRNSGGDLVSLRRNNSLTTLSVLRERPAATLSELAAATKLARASVADVVDDLLHLGWVVETAPTQGGSGRPARQYRFRNEAGSVLGLDLGINTMRASVADLGGNVLGSIRRRVPARASRAARIDAIGDVVTDSLAAAGVAAEDIWAVGVGATGIVEDPGVVRLSLGAKNWTGVDIASTIRRVVPAPVIVENDSRLAALAEHRRGVARAVDDMVFVHAGRRIGVALLLDGNVRRGYGGAAGEIDFLPDIDLDALAHHIEASPALPRRTSRANAMHVMFGAARDGDPRAMAAVRGYAADLARVVAPVVATLDPQMLVLGGGLSRSADLLEQPFLRALSTMCARPPEIRTSTLGDDCVTIGAVCLAIQHIDEVLLSNRLQGQLAAARRPALLMAVAESGSG
jgi:predicted NBD/HSP70 family sugar kinase